MGAIPLVSIRTRGLNGKRTLDRTPAPVVRGLCEARDPDRRRLLYRRLPAICEANVACDPVRIMGNDVNLGLTRNFNKVFRASM
jgi:hypothetical protein